MDRSIGDERRVLVPDLLLSFGSDVLIGLASVTREEGWIKIRELGLDKFAAKSDPALDPCVRIFVCDV
jgi:hypothetical protein